MLAYDKPELLAPASEIPACRKPGFGHSQYGIFWVYADF
jgi:hypothetical protein